MGDWESTFGEAGMSGGFNDSFRQKPNDWVQRTTTLYFGSGDEARQWAKEHPGQAIVRNPESDGFIASVLEWHDHYSGESYLECEKEEYFAWVRTRSIRKEAVSYAGQCMGLYSYEKAYWLYDNGYQDILLDLYREHQDCLRDGKTHAYKVQKEIGTRLNALLPTPFPENYYPGFF